MDRILFVQFANSMYDYTDECSEYWDAFFKKYKEFGYIRGKYFFEIPKWIAEIDFLIDKNVYEREVCFCQNSINEVVEKINKYKPKYTLFSLMDCNKNFIENVINIIPDATNYIVGGYNEEFIKYLERTYTNVSYAKTTKDESKIFGVEYKYGTDYSLFKGETVLPRLTLSYGCLNRCKFCIIPHGKVEEIDEDIIVQQVMSFKDLAFKLIYIDDKTFGQAKNYKILKKLTPIIRKYNKEFKGYVIQTTSGVLIKELKTFEDIDVKVAEIGMETYNDPILKKYNKPSNSKLVDKCIEVCKDSDLKLILNVVVGFDEETDETYKNTYNLIDKTLPNTVFGINTAIYTDYDNDENQGEIDFQNTDKIELHRKYWKKINTLGKEKLS